MSESNGPVRRRRIAGESGPAAPAQKAVSKKAVAKKAPAAKKGPAVKAPAAKKAPATKKAPVAKKGPAAKKAPVATPPVAKKSPRTTAGGTPGPVVKKPLPTPARAAAIPVEPRAERPAGSRPSRRDLWWLVPATVVAIAALVVGAYLVVRPPGASDSGSSLDAARRQASSAAASAAETIFSFRYDQLDEHLTASKALMTSGFAKDFDEIAPALTELAPQRNIVVQAVARESAALPCGDECSSTKADVLVFVDQARLLGDATEPTVFANRIKVSMVKSDDGWLVSNIRAL